MSRIAYDEKKELEEMVPGDYFDFIGGTGFGAYVLQRHRGKTTAQYGFTDTYRSC
jgi:hypothetical protein